MTTTDADLRRRQRLVADAILLERAITVMERRWPELLLRDVTAATARGFLFNGALMLRDESLKGLPRDEAADRA